MSTHSLIEISLSDLADNTIPSVISLFDQWGRGGVVVEQAPGKDGGTTLKTYLLPEDDESLRQIEIGLALLDQARHTPTPGDSPPLHPLPKPCIRFLSEKDWTEAWKTHYDVLRVGRRLVIKPTWCDYDPNPGDLIIELDPGMAFGSGLHPTTRLCLEAMEGHLAHGATVLDVGTGSGILAIAAARLGASRVLALDSDPLAVRVAHENVVLNQVGSVVRVEVGTMGIGESGNRGIGESGNRGIGESGNQGIGESGNRGIRESGNWGIGEPGNRGIRESGNRRTGESGNQGIRQSGNQGIGESGNRGIRESGNRGTIDLQSRSWDLVVANILAETIVELMPALVTNLAAEGTLIASGIIAARAEAVIASLHEHRLSLVERRDEGEWVALIACKQKDEERTTKDERKTEDR